MCAVASNDLLKHASFKAGIDDYTIVGRRLMLRPMRADLHDGFWVTLWRNQDEARAAFWFPQWPVTPDSHVAFMQQKSPYDLVWMVYDTSKTPEICGMAGLKIDPAANSGEMGRYYIDRNFRGKGLAAELDRMTMSFGFDFLHLQSIWLDAYAANEAILAVHTKVGWRLKGNDLVGHTHPGGEVVHMALTAAEWKALVD